MKAAIVNLAKHPLISGSGIIFLGSNAGNFFHLLFNFFMIRNLSISDYGVLASIFSLSTLPSLLYNAITPTVVSFAGVYFAQNDLVRVHGLFVKINRVAVSIGIFFFLIFTLFSVQVSSFLHITNAPYLIPLGGLMVLLGFISIVNISFIQAKLSFRFLSLLNFLTGFLKFLFGVLFIVIGFSVGGALGAVVVSSVLVYIISFIPIRFIFQKGVKIPNIPYKEILSFAIPAILTQLSITCFITVDLLLMKHFFNPPEAGLYAGLVLVGKIIFFFSAPIGMAMFPLIVQKKEKNEDYRSIFLFSLFLVFLPSFLLTAFYYLFPSFSIAFLLKNKEYLSIENLLWIYGAYMMFYSLLVLTANYFLSIKKTKVYIPLLIGACLQSVLIWYYHTSFLQVITISLSIVVVLLIVLLYYFFRLYGEK